MRAQVGVAWVLGQLNRPHEAVDVARKSLELLRRGACQTPGRMRMALHQLAGALALVGSYEETLESPVSRKPREALRTRRTSG